MCLAIPAKIISFDGNYATVDFDGIQKQICIALLDELTVGDYVIVHAGFAINKLDLDEAKKTLELFRQLTDEDTGRIH
jgi:hydrogenase expression/formation protein HypC